MEAPAVKKLLEELLEKYEQGKRPLIKIAENNFPRYFTDGEFKALFHAALKDWEREGFITLVWERFEKDNLLRHVKLNPEKAELLYEKLSRQKPQEKEEHYRKLWANLNDFPAWLGELKKDMLLEPLFDDDAEIMVTVLNALSLNNEEIPKRVFSQRYLGDSKLFLKVERKVAALLQKYYFKDIEVSGDAVFSEFGVVNNPVYLHLAGPVILKYPDGRLFNLKGLNYDVAFPAGLALQLEIADFAAQRVVTVENLTSYYQYVRRYPEDLVLYLGGFAGKMERKFLRKIYEYCLNRGFNIDFYHWGDIDLGGFNIFLHLKRETGIPFKPLWMDLDTLLKYKERGMKLSESYRRKLTKALEDPVYQDFRTVIEMMLTLNIRLEQEAIEL
ncbi:DUF2220 domain-containing protein [Carboxydothermus pertinax]|uniref:Wadjet protein JetD C-terminal domain-containing protein n=1 Tax=Carboxydothermus pertinax TaxID=870242 RepID=A0A1L8CX85_9THEO|nr:DUF2220 domain-containing protein [Carboxydothermus pertinax]GAV23545.1 hypothetical protein cpu_20550 [Carboxydothermus pertinax]